MKTTEIDNSIIGKRVKGVFTGMEVTGIITDIVDYYSRTWDAINGGFSGDEYLCSKGVRIKLDEGIMWGDDIYFDYESTARVDDEEGNLRFTHII